MEENKTNKQHGWLDLFSKLFYLIPEKVVPWLDDKTAKRRKNPLTVIISIMIGLLAVASVTNLSARAYSHHAGLSAYVAGFGMASLVPIAVFCAVYLDISKLAKMFIWLIAVLFAVISATIQVNIYAPLGLYHDGLFEFEALSFGAGIPVAECLLAVIDGILIQHFTAKKIKEDLAQAELARIEAEQKRKNALEEEDRMKRREAEEEEKRIRAEEIAHKREMDRLLAEAELARKNALAAAEIEGKRLMLEAKIANQKAKQDASLLRGGGSRTVSHPVSGDTNGGAHGDTRQEGDADQDTKIRSVLTHLIDKGDTGATDIARTLNIGRKTVYRYLNRLTDEGLVRKVEKPGKPGQYTWEPVLPDIKHTDSAHVELSANGVAVH